MGDGKMPVSIIMTSRPSRSRTLFRKSASWPLVSRVTTSNAVCFVLLLDVIAVQNTNSLPPSSTSSCPLAHGAWKHYIVASASALGGNGSFGRHQILQLLQVFGPKRQLALFNLLDNSSDLIVEWRRNPGLAAFGSDQPVHVMDFRRPPLHHVLEEG